MRLRRPYERLSKARKIEKKLHEKLGKIAEKGGIDVL